MEKNNLIQILMTFTSKEMREFGLFTASPFFNKNRNVLKLFKLLEKEYPEFQIDRVKKEILYMRIFPGAPYSDENMKTIIYLLSRLAEKYMAYRKFQADPFAEQFKLLSSLDKRRLDKLFIKHEKRTSAEMESINGIELGLVEKKISFEKIRASFYSERNDEETMYRSEIKSGGLMITAFLIEMFRLINLFARVKYLGFELEYDYATELLKNIDLQKFLAVMKENAYENLPVLEVYYHLYNSLNEMNSDEHYNEFKKSFEQNRRQLGNHEQYILSTLMVNCLYYKHLKDSTKYDRELFEAFKILISLYEYSGDQYLRAVVYTNVLRLAVQFKEFEWTENYIKEYSGKLKPEHKENMYFYSNAYLSFARGKFEKSLEYASRINFSTFQMKYYLRDLQLSAYYELSRFDSALDMIDAYRHFIKKERNYSDKLKQGYIEFIRCLQQLIKFRLGESKTDLESLKQKTMAANSMRKNWLLEKIEELEKMQA